MVASSCFFEQNNPAYFGVSVMKDFKSVEIEYQMTVLSQRGIDHGRLIVLQAKLCEWFDSKRVLRGDVIFQEVLSIIELQLALDCESHPMAISERIIDPLNRIMGDNYLTVPTLSAKELEDDLEKVRRYLSSAKQRIVRNQEKARKIVRRILASNRLQVPKI